jgi:hypothetical protein
MNPRFFTASQATRARLRDRSVQLGDKVRRHHSNPEIWEVSAQSFSTDKVKAYYKVDTVNVTCTCKGFQLKGICRHLCRVSWELWLAEQKERYPNVIPFLAPQVAA